MDLDGRISFTQLFIDRFSAGDSANTAYQNTLTELANKEIPYSVMRPQLEEGMPLASTTYLGGAFGVAGLYPVIMDQTKDTVIPADTYLPIYATLSSLDRVTAVWAVITPPNYVAPTSSGDFQTPNTAMPTLKLTGNPTGKKFEGTYQDFRISGDYRITFYAATGTGHISSSPSTTITVTGGINLVDPGDINNDKVVNLADAILGLQIVSGISTSGKTIARGADVNGDKKVGLPEVIYILQKVGGIR
jgi:hypothetical protein